MKTGQKVNPMTTPLFNPAHPVALAVEPLRQDAMQRAQDFAQRIIDKTREELEAHGWDRQAAAPYPKAHAPGDYHANKRKYDRCQNLASSVKVPGAFASRSFGAPDPCEMDAAKCERFIKGAREDASAQYDAFICKLISKVGDCTAATLDGSHVWGYSTLTITKADGAVERWKTQQIVNVSKLGKLFNQFPTRLIK